MLKLKISFFFTILCLSTVMAQSYQVTTLTKNMYKTTSSGIMHEFIQIDNLLGTDFSMRWVAIQGSKTGCPSSWDIGVSDPDSVYSSLNIGDSADFILSGTNSTNNKIVLSVNHNNTIGDCIINFRIYPLSNPSNETTIGFNIEVTQDATFVRDHNMENNQYGYPNPVINSFNFNSKVIKYILFDINGQKVKSGNNSKSVDMECLPKGVYLVMAEIEKGIYQNFKVIK